MGLRGFRNGETDALGRVGYVIMVLGGNLWLVGSFLFGEDKAVCYLTVG